MFTQYEVRVLRKSKRLSRDFKKWDAWTGQFQCSEYTQEMVEKHVRKHFKSKSYYNCFRFGIFGCAISQHKYSRRNLGRDLKHSPKDFVSFNNWYLLKVM